MAVLSMGIPGIRTESFEIDTVCPPPSLINDGDILLLIANTQDPIGFITSTPPAGFSDVSGYSGGLLFSSVFLGSFTRTYAWWKRASSESGSYTVTHLLTAGSAVCLCYSGAISSGDPTTNPIATINSGTAPDTVVALSGTTSRFGSAVVFVAQGGDAATIPTSTNPLFSSRFNLLGSSPYGGDGPFLSSGATGNFTGASVSSGEWMAALIFIEAASQTIARRKA